MKLIPGGGTPGGAALRVHILGCAVDVVDMRTAVDRLVELVEQRRHQTAPAVVVTLNPEIVMRARREPDLRRIINGAGLVIPDGIGLVRAMRRRGHPGAQRVTGIDLIEAYCPRAAALGHRLALAGGAPGVAEAAAATLAARTPGLLIVAADPGDPGPGVARRLASAGPDVVLAAYGGGAQERFLDGHLAATGAGVGIGVGGALDFLAGRVRRAPAPVRRAGMEWAWRLACQPWRVRRQAVLPVFWWLTRLETRTRR